jgi:hypothetical protein
MSEKLKVAIVGGFCLIVGAVIGVWGTKTAAQKAADAQVTAAWIPIHATETAEARLTQIALSATPYPTSTETPVFTPTPAYSDAINVMNNFFSWINNAGNKDDLKRSWDLETSGINGLQCREAAGCSFSSFQDWWWKWKVQYKLYDCGSNVVNVEVRYFLRDVLLASTPLAPEYCRYQLVDDHGQLKLNRGDNIEGPGADCSLTITVP